MVFQLHPFFQENVNSPRVSCRIELQGRRLQFEFVLPKEHFNAFGWTAIPQGELKKSPEPTLGLWNSTCFELFLSHGESNYWEWNFSPSGEWNLFSFSDYRHGQAQPKIDLSSFTISRSSLGDRFLLQGHVSLFKDNPEIWVFPTAVSKAENGKLNYWAPIHPKEKPDFHLKKNFVRLA